MTDFQPPSPPPELPTFIFILSEWNSRPVAIDAANAIQTVDDSVSVRSFYEPIHDAMEAFVDIDFAIDLADPRQNPLKDLQDSLEKWCNEFFGADKLGNLALIEAKQNLAIQDRTIIYVDASWTFIRPFIEAYKPHELMIVDLSPSILNPRVVPEDLYKKIAARHILVAAPTVENVVKAIVEFDA